MADRNSCLIVDDSPLVRRILGLVLSHLGFAILEADGVPAALSLCEHSQPDLAMVDWNLRGEDGIALIQQLRRLPGGERMKLIMCTLERSVSHIETALAAGADEYATKPFGIEVLETKLGYLGFDVSARLADPVLRRRLSRLILTGMAIGGAEETALEPGMPLFAEGDAPDSAYLLLEGEIDLRGPAGAARRGPLDLVGGEALTDAGPRRTTARALGRCAMVRLPRAGFQAELAGLSPFLRNWLECLADEAETK